MRNGGIMGSLFYVTIPIRDHEISIRQKMHHIVVLKEKENIAKGATDGYLSEPPNTLSIKNSPNPRQIEDAENVQDIVKTSSPIEAAIPQLTIAGNLKEDKNTLVDVYTAEVDGVKANIVVSSDSMAIYTPEEFRKADAGRKENKRKIDESEYEDERALQVIINNTFLEKHLRDSLKKFNITNAKWSNSIEGYFAVVTFTVDKDNSEEIIQYMLTLGIGTKYQSTLSVCAAVIFYSESTEAQKNSNAQIPQEEQTNAKNTFASKFKASIKSRLTVAQVIQTVEANAILTFDYIILIIVAAMIAAIGLLGNNPVSIVASMLISPLMGPIMAGCFGAVIRDAKLVKTGVLSEVVGLAICLLVGFIFGICVTCEVFRGPWAAAKRWPTDEMVSRSLLDTGMVVGILVAIPSGAGVALSILAGNAGSLVGVAISASLLPPAVNAGLFWGMSAVISVHEQIQDRPSFLSCSDSLGPPGHYAIDHNTVYCENVLIEFAILGICSFGLTIINIIVILTIGAIFLKIKEVAPHTTRNAMKRFWKEDLKVMRAYNRDHGSFDKHALLTELMENDHAGEIKEDVTNDHIFNQVNRRNLFGPGAVVLDPTDSDAKNRSRDVEAGGDGNIARKASTANPAWTFGGWLFGTKGKSKNTDNEELEAENNSDARKNPGDKLPNTPVKEVARARPHLL